MTEELFEYVGGASVLRYVGGEAMPQHVRMNRSPQVGTGRQPGQQLINTARPHSGPDGVGKQIHKQEVRPSGGVHAFPLCDVLVVGLNGQPVSRNDTLPAGLCPRPVRIRPSHHMQVRAPKAAAHAKDGKTRDVKDVPDTPTVTVPDTYGSTEMRRPRQSFKTQQNDTCGSSKGNRGPGATGLPVEGRLRIVGRSTVLSAKAARELAAYMEPSKGAHPWPEVITETMLNWFSKDKGPVAITRVEPLVVEISVDIA